MKNINIVELFALLSLNDYDSKSQFAKRLNFDIFLLGIIMINLSDSGFKIYKNKSDFKLLKKINLIEEEYNKLFIKRCKEGTLENALDFFYQNPKLSKEIEITIFEHLVFKKLLRKEIVNTHGFTNNNYIVATSVLDEAIEYFRLEVLEKKYNPKILSIYNIFKRLDMLKDYFSDKEIAEIQKKYSEKTDISDVIIDLVFLQIKNT